MSDTPDNEQLESNLGPVGVPLHQVSQEDLETLERLLPELMWAAASQQKFSTSLRVRWAKVQVIVSSVRWGGGPPLHIERVDA